MHCKIEASFCLHHHMFCCTMTILPMSYILEDLNDRFRLIYQLMIKTCNVALIIPVEYKL